MATKTGTKMPIHSFNVIPVFIVFFSCTLLLLIMVWSTMLMYCLRGNALENGYFLRIGKRYLNEIIARNKVMFI